MWDVVGLGGVCVAMAFGTYVIGTLPLAFHLSRSGLRKLELWGSGLLLGAALTVVIPEGIASVYKGRHLCHGDEPIAPPSGRLTSKDLIAACLLSGFLLMFMYVGPHALEEQQPTLELHVEQERENLHSVPWQPSDEEGGEWLPARESLHRALSGLLGLLIHALADGIALGASVGSSDTSLRIVVVLAIMVHKAPASIGTCTLLMSRQLRRADVRWAVFVFSITTPIGALVTYGVIALFFRVTGGAGATINARDIGAILSFSGGTFLFVAMHAVLELTAEPTPPECAPHIDHTHAHHPHDQDHPIHAHALSPGPAPLDTHRHSERTNTAFCLFLVVLGSVTPRLLQLVLGDAHGGGE